MIELYIKTDIEISFHRLRLYGNLCGVPEELEFQTKPELGLELLRRAI